jgi:hypothetical protein
VRELSYLNSDPSGSGGKRAVQIMADAFPDLVAWRKEILGQNVERVPFGKQDVQNRSESGVQEETHRKVQITVLNADERHVPCP